MFFHRDKAEEFANMELRKRIYRVQTEISNEGLMNSVQKGKHRVFISPWKEDIDLAEMLLEKASVLSVEQFLARYGADLEELEENYL